jgi:hypothetical protein
MGFTSSSTAFWRLARSSSAPCQRQERLVVGAKGLGRERLESLLQLVLRLLEDLHLFLLGIETSQGVGKLGPTLAQLLADRLVPTLLLGPLGGLSLQVLPLAAQPLLHGRNLTPMPRSDDQYPDHGPEKQPDHTTEEKSRKIHG